MSATYGLHIRIPFLGNTTRLNRPRHVIEGRNVVAREQDPKS